MHSAYTSENLSAYTNENNQKNVIFNNIQVLSNLHVAM